MDLLGKIMAKESAIDSVVYTDDIGFLVEEASEGVYKVLVPGGTLPDVAFQRGFHAEVGINGYTNEMLLALLIHRTKQLDELCPSEHNTAAIDHMLSAQQAFRARTEERQARGVEGTAQE